MIKPAKTFFSFRFWKKKDDVNKPVVGRLLETAPIIRRLSGGSQDFQLWFSIYIYPWFPRECLSGGYFENEIPTQYQ
jgi:hypothetical protein